MREIQSREEAVELMNHFDSLWQLCERDAIEALGALKDFFMTEEQKEAMNNAAYKFALQIGVDPDFAKFWYFEPSVDQ